MSVTLVYFLKYHLLQLYNELMYVCTQFLSPIQLYATPWIVAHQAPLPMGFLRQEYQNGLLFPFPGDLPDPGIEPASPALMQVLYH